MAATNNETVIGSGAKFKGDLTLDGGATVLGAFEGSITGKGRVHIGEGSACKAAVTAKEIAVEGHLEGNVEAGDRVEILPNGRITGDVIAGRMNMAEGASINGYCRIGAVASNNGSVTPATSTTEVKPDAAAKPAANKSGTKPVATKA